MLVADDHRHDVIGSLGDGSVQTPYLDRLAAQGAACLRAHDMGGNFPAVCVPTRGALMTGCQVFRALADQTGGVIASDRPTIGQHLRSEGYNTHIVGKWHNDLPSLHRSFEGGEGIFLRGLTTDQYAMRVHHFDPTGLYSSKTVYHTHQFSTDFLCDHAVEYLNGYRSDEPFFLYTGFTAPHDPRTPPKEFAARYHPDRIALPANYSSVHPFDNGEMHIRDEDLAPHPRTPDRVRRELADYYGMVSSVDAGVGRILAALEASGRAEDTIVVYTGDHGIALGQHGLMGKQNLYDHSVRVPMIVRGPGVRPGTRSEALVYSWDLFPTLCALAGINTPADIDARSFMQVLKGEEVAHRTEVGALYRDCQRMIKDERWKLIEYAVGGVRHSQLFDLAGDPWEKNNLACDAAAAGELASMRERLGRWQRSVGDRLALAA